MSLAVLRSRALAGMEAPSVSVEVHLANGLPSFTILGMKYTTLFSVVNLSGWLQPKNNSGGLSNWKEIAYPGPVMALSIKSMS